MKATNIQDHLTVIEKHVQAMNKVASIAAPSEGATAKMREGWAILARLVGEIPNPAQGEVSASFYGLQQEAPPEPRAASTQPPQASQGSQARQVLTFDVYRANAELAQEIIARAEETSDTIDRLVAAGKKFAASRAREDLHAVTSKVAGILHSTTLVEPWVAEDLVKLAARGEELHKPFHPSK